jgi:hypothetical protein
MPGFLELNNKGNMEGTGEKGLGKRGSEGEMGKRRGKEQGITRLGRRRDFLIENLNRI